MKRPAPATRTGTITWSGWRRAPGSWRRMRRRSFFPNLTLIDGDFEQELAARGKALNAVGVLPSHPEPAFPISCHDDGILGSADTYNASPNARNAFLEARSGSVRARNAS
jgi:hypothetical protein